MKFRLVLPFILMSFTVAQAQTQTADFFNVNPVDGNGIRLRGSDNNKIHMGNSTNYWYGPVTNYSIKMNMSNVSTRGWTWGVNGVTPIAALNTQGNMQIAGNFIAEGNITAQGDFIAPNGFSGNSYLVNDGAGNGYKFASDVWRIDRSNDVNHKYGPVTNWSMKLSTDNNHVNGWTFGPVDQLPVAAISADGNMQIAKDFVAEGTITALGGFIAPDGFSTTNYTLKVGNGNGIKFWENDNYKIHMGTGTAYAYGPVANYSIKTTMDGGTGRGWTWGGPGEVPVVAIGNTGNMQIKGNFIAEGDITAQGNFTAPDGFKSSNFSLEAIDGNGIRFWNDDDYKIHMGTGTEYAYGPVTNYSIKMNMDSNGGRGWTWGGSGSTPIAALGNTGNMQIKGDFLSEGDITAQGDFIAPNGFRSTTFSAEQGEGNGFRFWNNDAYKIHMGNSSEYTYGPVNGFSIKMNMNTNGGWGWTWGTPGAEPVAALGNNGNLQIKGNFIAEGTITADDLVINGESITGGSSPWTELGSDVYYNGFVGIGTPTPDEKLTVKGKIHAEEVIVDLNVPGPDYVFEEDYPLQTLEEVDAYVKSEKHLPGIPSARQMEQEGIGLSEMNMKLLEKVEELTLHLIELNERVKKLEEENQALRGEE